MARAPVRTMPGPFRRLALPAGAFALLAIAGPWLAPHDPLALAADPALHSLGPSAQHWFGTDPLGRDIASRLLAGARPSIGIAAAALTLSTVFGTLVGTVAESSVALIDRLVMRTVDALLAIPRVVLLLAAVGLWGTVSPVSLALLLGGTSWFALARLVRHTLRVQRGLDRVEAGRALGLGAGRLATHHLLPEVGSVLAVWASGEFGQLLLLETGLSFLGLGIPAPHPTWGRVLLETSDVFGDARWLVLGPGAVIAGAVWLAFRAGDNVADTEVARAASSAP